MSKEVLDEREFELVNIIGADLAVNQRDLSRHMNLSLGMVNMLIRRLISKGFIRIEQLNKRKVQYILTPKGFAEKMRKSVKYTWKTINSISLIKNNLKEIIQNLYKQGHREFYILGESDFAILVEMVIQEVKQNDCSISFIKDLPAVKLSGVMLICKENVGSAPSRVDHSVDLVKELATAGVAIY